MEREGRHIISTGQLSKYIQSTYKEGIKVFFCTNALLSNILVINRSGAGADIGRNGKLTM